MVEREGRVLGGFSAVCGAVCAAEEQERPSYWR